MTDDQAGDQLLLTMTDEELAAQRRHAFGDALRQAMAHAGWTQDALAEAIGFRQASISAWISGKSQPDIDTTFVIERTLGQRPGALTRHLGYLPPEALRSVATVESSILEDGALSEAEKQMLLGAYRAAMATKTTRRGRPRRA